MTLEKTLENIKKTNKGHFNTEIKLVQGSDSKYHFYNTDIEYQELFINDVYKNYLNCILNYNSLERKYYLTKDNGILLFRPF